MSKKIDEIKKNIELYDLYKKLLNAKQRKQFELHYFEDKSLTEISKDFNLTRQAISISLREIRNLLQDYENKIEFLKYIKKGGN